LDKIFRRIFRRDMTIFADASALTAMIARAAGWQRRADRLD
jgi:hypothetical protein